jgi:hypothetical protein
MEESDQESGQDRAQRRPAKPEQGFGRDVFGYRRFQLRRDIRHFPDLDEVEVVEQADPEDAEEDVSPAKHRDPEDHVGAAVDAPERDYHDDRQEHADDHRVPEVEQNSSHGFPLVPFPSHRPHEGNSVIQGRAQSRRAGPCRRMTP